MPREAALSGLGVAAGERASRSATVSSAGGYLRALTQIAEAAEFSLGPILMAQINALMRGQKSQTG